MPRYVYYDRRTVNTKETQFFHESRNKHADKEIGTNMEQDGQFPVNIVIKKISVLLPMQLVSSVTAKDSTIDDQVKILLEEAIIQMQVGTGPVYYLPVASALAKVDVKGDLEYTLTTAADGSYSILHLTGEGLEIDVPVPADTLFKFFIKTKTTPNMGKVTTMLDVETA